MSSLKNGIRRLVQKEFDSLDSLRSVYFDPSDYESAITELDRQLKESQFREKGLRSQLEHYKFLSEDDINKVILVIVLHLMSLTMCSVRLCHWSKLTRPK